MLTLAFIDLPFLTVAERIESNSMEPLIFLIIALVGGSPIVLIVLAVRHRRLSRRVRELEGSVRLLEKRLATWPRLESPPVVSKSLEFRREAREEEGAFEIPELIASPPLVAEPLEELAPAVPVPPPLPVGPTLAATTVTDESRKILDWEKFLGVKLFAWIGGLALFLGISFFVKYSFEHNLVPPEIRVGLGFLVGLGLVIGGVMMRRKEYVVTAHTLCATGIVVLYGVSFATHGVYNLIGSGPVFLLMTLITSAAFVLAVRLNAKVVAVLGLAGAFLTPPLLSTGQDRPFGLFSYIALLDIGLLAVAFRQRWHFLVLMGAIGTGLMELGWFFKFFEAPKAITALAILTIFNAIWTSGLFFSERVDQRNRHSAVAVMTQSAVTFFAVLSMIALPGMAQRPGVLLALILIADLPLVLLPLARLNLFRGQIAGGAAAFCALALWISTNLREEHLFWALGASLIFALLHSVYPLVLQRLRKIETAESWLNLFPLASIGLLLLTLFQFQAVSLAIWPVIFLLNLLVIGLAFLTASFAGAVGAVLLTGVVTVAWLFKLPSDATGLSLVLILALFAALFFAAGIWLAQRTTAVLDAQAGTANPMQRGLPALSALLPFLLLALMIARLNILNPSHIFGLGVVLAGMLLWLGTRTRAGELHLVALVASLFLQFFWHANKQQETNNGISLFWFVLFYAAFTAFPFVYRKTLQERAWPWVTAALSGPLHFYLIYKTTLALLPDFNGLGLLPVLMAIPAMAALLAVLKRFETTPEQQTRLLALFGGSALFFLTMVFPIQFSRQWLTLGWALEGVALLWLFHRVPHRGLPIVGIGLLVVAFIRLGLNPGVFSYYERSEVRVFNWYFYSYGLVSTCLLVGARLLAPPRNLVLKRNAPPLLYSLGTILAFILLNIEIADFFAEGRYLQFDFSGNFARDMTYSIAWSLFAFGLLLIGICKDLAPVRYASMALLGVTLVKLFFHDLSQLGQLYRIGAFIGVSTVLMLASWVYQRFLAATANKQT